MGYNTLLDGFFGNRWLSIGLLVLYVVTLIFFYKKLFGGEKKKRVLSAFLLYGVPILWLIIVGSVNQTCWGYGRPSGMVGIYSQNGKLIVHDYQMTAGGKFSNGSPYSRIHVIDPANGERLLRFHIGAGKGDVIALYSDTLVYCDNTDLYFYSLTDGHPPAVWSGETLPKLFPELAAGVNNFSAYQTKNDLHVTGMDGNRWVIDIRSKRITPDDNTAPRVASGKIFIDNGMLMLDNDAYAPDLLIGFSYKNNGSEQQVLSTGSDSVLNSELLFLQGKIVAFSSTDSCFVVQHYETTDQKNAIFTCMSWDGQTKHWQIRQSDLRPDDADEEYPLSVSGALDESGRVFIMSFDTELIAVGLLDGQLKWREIP